MGEGLGHVAVNTSVLPRNKPGFPFVVIPYDIDEPLVVRYGHTTFLVVRTGREDDDISRLLLLVEQSDLKVDAA